MAEEPEPEERPKKLESGLSAKKLTRQMVEHTSNKKVKDYIIADIRRQWMVRNLNADDDERLDNEDLNIPLQTEPCKAPVKRREDIESVMASLRTVHHKQTDKVQIKRKRPVR